MAHSLNFMLPFKFELCLFNFELNIFSRESLPSPANYLAALLTQATLCCWPNTGAPISRAAQRH